MIDCERPDLLAQLEAEQAQLRADMARPYQQQRADLANLLALLKKGYRPKAKARGRDGRHLVGVRKAS